MIYWFEKYFLLRAYEGADLDPALDVMGMIPIGGGDAEWRRRVKDSSEHR